MARLEEEAKQGIEVSSMQTLQLPVSLAAYRIGNSQIFVHAIGTSLSQPS